MGRGQSHNCLMKCMLCKRAGFIGYLFYTIAMLAHVVRHSAIQAIGRITGLVIGLFSIALLTRYLGQTGFGWYIVAFSWLQIFAIVVDFGLYMVGLKLLGGIQESDVGNSKNAVFGREYIFSQIFWLRLFSAIMFVLILPHIIWLFPYDVPVKWAVTILSWSFFLASINQLLTVSFQHRVKMQYVAYSEIVGKALALAALLAVIWLDMGFFAAIATSVLYGVVQSILLFSWLGSHYRITWFWDQTLVKRILKEAWPLGLIIIFNTLYFKADTIILSWFWPASEVGLYGAAYKVLEIMVSFPPMYLGLMLPLLSQQWLAGKKDLFFLYVQKSFDLFSFIAFPLVAGVIALAAPIMILIAGGGFTRAAAWLSILIIACGLIFFGQLFGYVLLSTGRQKVQLKVYIAVAVLALTLYMVFIPSFGAYAAAWITVIAEGCATFWLGIRVAKDINCRPSFRKAALYAVSAIGMYAAVVWLSPYILWWWLIGIGAIVYIGLLKMFGVWQLRQIKEFFAIHGK